MLLVTKSKTSNLGNAALTTELVAALTSIGQQAQTPDIDVLGRPCGVQMYDSHLLSSVGALGVWRRANRIGLALRPLRLALSRSYRMQRAVPPNACARMESVTVSSGHLRLEPMRRKLRRLAAAFRYLPFWPSFARRLMRMLLAETVAYSGAGEVVDGDIVIRQLFELAVAQGMGLRTMMINQSVEVRNFDIRTLLGLVYSKANAIWVRGEDSRRELISMGVAPELVRLAPDTAFLIDPRNPFTRRDGGNPKRVAVAFNGFVRKPDVDAVVACCVHLQQQGWTVSLTSSDWPNDRHFAHAVASRADCAVEPPAGGYLEYVDQLSRLDVVLSNRLHTCVMAMAAGALAVPVAVGQHKTHEALTLVGYPVQTLEWDDPDLALKAAKVADRAFDDDLRAASREAYLRGRRSAALSLEELLTGRTSSVTATNPVTRRV